MRTLAVAVMAALLLGGCSADDKAGAADKATDKAADKASAASTPSPAGESCGEEVRTDALPEWARAGFSWDGSGTKHVFGARGGIMAILFGYPMTSPPDPKRGNKILWVAREPIERGGDLQIKATLAGTTVTADQTVAGGPGPSIVDLPRPGCWHLTLTWAEKTDEMDLTYVP